MTQITQLFAKKIAKICVIRVPLLKSRLRRQNVLRYIGLDKKTSVGAGFKPTPTNQFLTE